jgi:pimeloyl-ACP methyl ester carboxylesterase
MKDGCDKLGWDFRAITRNADRDRYDADLAGSWGFGDVTGAKLGTLKTYLQDAADAGARFVVNCNVDRCSWRTVAAAGVAGTYRDDEGRHRERRRARADGRLAAGALDTPAVLLRSGIGGPAAGDYLRLHPGQRDARGLRRAAEGLVGRAADRAERRVRQRRGRLRLPDRDRAREPARYRVVGAVGDRPAAQGVHGAGAGDVVAGHADPRPRPRPVTIDGAGNPVHSYDLADAIDIKNFRRALAEIARLNEAAGAQEIYTLHRKLTRWSRATGEDIEVFAKRAHDGALDPYEHATFSLHHMGSARMGKDPATSVADPWGQLHDTPGVWIGDASAFPSASGTNPMITTMALAPPHRSEHAALMPFFKHEGHRLAYTSFGSGPRTCVLIHGLLLSQKMHLPLAKDLAARGNRVVTLDLLGHGRSDRPRDMSRYSMTSFGAEVIGLLDHLDIDEAVIAGTSLGANTALEVLSAAPERVRGAVIEMPVLDNALMGCAIAFTPLMVALTFGEPVMRGSVRSLARSRPGAAPSGRTSRSTRSARTGAERRRAARALLRARGAPSHRAPDVPGAHAGDRPSPRPGPSVQRLGHARQGDAQRPAARGGLPDRAEAQPRATDRRDR